MNWLNDLLALFGPVFTLSMADTDGLLGDADAGASGGEGDSAGGDGDDAGGGGGAGGGGDGGDGNGAAGAALEGFDTRPDWLNEKYYDAEQKTPRIQEMAAGIKELETKLRDGKPQAPESPDAYDFDLGDNPPVELPADDPVVAWFRAECHENGVSQEVARKLFDGYIKKASELMPAPITKEAELAKLGDAGDAVVESMTAKLQQFTSTGLFGENDVREFKVFCATAEGARTMQKIFEYYGEQALPATSAAAEGLPSKQELYAEYNQVVQEGVHKGKQRIAVDPEFARRMEEKFEKVFGTGDAGTSETIMPS